jgi:hypothetical protein
MKIHGDEQSRHRDGRGFRDPAERTERRGQKNRQNRIQEKQIPRFLSHPPKAALSEYKDDDESEKEAKGFRRQPAEEKGAKRAAKTNYEGDGGSREHD